MWYEKISIILCDVSYSVSYIKNKLLGRVIGQIHLLKTNFHFTFASD